MSKKQKFVDAFHRYRESKEKDDKRQAAIIEGQTRARFLETFGFEPDSVHIRTVEFDGIKLRNHHHHPDGWQVVGICPRCGESVLSDTEYKIEGIGRWIEEFEPHKRHLCRSQADSLAYLRDRVDEIVWDIVNIIRTQVREQVLSTRPGKEND